jgi:hypothetical protein
MPPPRGTLDGPRPRCVEVRHGEASTRRNLREPKKCRWRPTGRSARTQGPAWRVGVSPSNQYLPTTYDPPNDSPIGESSLPVEAGERRDASPAERLVARKRDAESETALESSDFSLAAHQAAALLHQRPGEGPLLLLPSRASMALVQDGRGFDPVWEPPGK